MSRRAQFPTPSPESAQFQSELANGFCARSPIWVTSQIFSRGSLVNRSSNTLGVVTSGLDYYGPSRTLVGVEQTANDLGYSLLLDLLHRPEDENVDAVLDDLVARRVDGIIWAVHEVDANRRWINEERLRSLPPIIFLTMETKPHVSIVSTDNRAGACR